MSNNTVWGVALFIMYSELDICAFIERLTPDEYKDLCQEKRFIWFAITDAAALKFRNQDYIIKDIRIMAKKVVESREKREPITTTPKPVKKTTRWVDFNIRSKDDKAAVREYAKEVDTILDTLVMLLDEGYDLVCKRRDDGATISTMLFCNITGHPHNGFALSAAAPDAWLSIAALVYKHVVGLQGEWGGNDGDDESDQAW